MHTADFIMERTREVFAYGYIPVIAHIERYPAMTSQPELMQILSDMGALIQLNADAVLGVDGRQMKKICHGILKEGLGDIIASDCHGMRYRPSHLAECCEYVESKYGREKAEELFYHNPRKIIRKLEELSNKGVRK